MIGHCFLFLHALCRHTVKTDTDTWNKSEGPDIIELDFYNNMVWDRHKRSTSTLTFYQSGKDLARQMTKTLDELLGPNYNKRIRPNFGGKPVEIELNFAVNAMVSRIPSK